MKICKDVEGEIVIHLGHLREKRGVSPVIAVVLMIAVAVAISVILFAWSSGFVSERSSIESAESEQLVVEEMRISGTSLTVFIRNKSFASAFLDSIYVNGQLRASGVNQHIDGKAVTELPISQIIQSHGGDGTIYDGDQIQLVTKRSTQLRFKAKE